MDRGTHEITFNLTLNFGNQNSVGYYTKNIQKGGKISFAIEFVYYIYIYKWLQYFSNNDDDGWWY